MKVENFWSKVEKIPFHSCWEWIAAQKDGYGRFGSSGYAHRYSYELHKGKIPQGLFVCHHCDNPSCVNPDHLFLGTNEDNVRDMFQKNRNSPPPYRAGWNRKELPANLISLLGKLSDAEIGRRAGFSKYVVARIRKQKRISALPSQTRFKSGDPHPCWSRRKGG